MKFYIVRHALAEKRLNWDAPDRLRPLASRGVRQSISLAKSLVDRGVKRIVTSPHLRCVQTVEPLSTLTGLPIQRDERLAEGADPEKALELVEELGRAPAVLCSHGDVIPGLLYELEERGVDLETGARLRCAKGSVWVASGSIGPALRATYTPAPHTEPSVVGDLERLAVLDMGSTSFRLVLFEATRAGRLKPIVDERAMLRLGAAIAKDGRIPEDACEEAVAAAERLIEVARQADAHRILPVGTAVLRDAKNGSALGRRIGKALGARVRVLSGEEEAHLVFRAFQRRVLLPGGMTLGIDLGGGSLELVLGDARDIHWAATLPIGVTRLQRELVGHDPMRKREARGVRERLLDELEPHRKAIAGFAPEMCVAAGGTARAFERLCSVQRGSRTNGPEAGSKISVEELGEWTRELVRADHDERVTIRGVRDNRADLLPTGGILLTTLAETLGFDSYRVCDWGLREGVALEALQPR